MTGANPAAARWSVALSTLGCRLNQVESQEVLSVLEGHGFRAAAPTESADVYVVNTCTVTGRADFSDRQLIRRIASTGTILLVEHNMPVVLDLATKVTVMDKGAILAEGTPAEIEAHPGVQKAYLGL